MLIQSSPDAPKGLDTYLLRHRAFTTGGNTLCCPHRTVCTGMMDFITSYVLFGLFVHTIYVGYLTRVFCVYS